MSKGPKLTLVPVYGVKSPVPPRLLRPAGISTTSCPLMRTWTWPTPLSKSSRSKPRNVRNVCWPVGIDLAFNVKVPELEAWPASPLYKPVNN